MKARCIQTFQFGERIAKVMSPNEYGEYVVRLYILGHHHTGADYFTDDKADAIGTARLMADRSLVHKKELV